MKKLAQSLTLATALLAPRGIGDDIFISEPVDSAELLECNDVVQTAIDAHEALFAHEKGVCMSPDLHLAGGHINTLCGAKRMHINSLIEDALASAEDCSPAIQSLVGTLVGVPISE